MAARASLAMSAMLSVRNVTQKFGGLTALDDVSFDVAAGELVGLVGPNGAGKSTLFNAIAGVRRPSSIRPRKPTGTASSMRPVAAM